VTASTFSLESRNAYAFSSFAGFAGDLYDPFAVDAPEADFFVGGSMSAPHVTEKVDNDSFAVADMMGFLNDQVLVTVGARFQSISTASSNASREGRTAGLGNRIGLISSDSDHSIWTSTGIDRKTGPVGGVNAV
jgi:iron complex outermembrane receptor protein